MGWKMKAVRGAAYVAYYIACCALVIGTVVYFNINIPN
jgi:hypothetical protein